MVNIGEIHAVAIFPNAVLNIVITSRAPYELKNTINWLYLVAMIIAKKNVLSPTSLTSMAKKEVVKPVWVEGGFGTF